MKINNYQIIRELGRNREGGRITYLAEYGDTGQRVVVKQFRFAGEASWQGFKIYEREIQILQEIDHPRIPQYLDSLETPDGFCMVQEYKDAPSLATKTSFTPPEIKQVLVSILEILVDLQRRIPPIIHRDLKPENILVDRDRQAYLIDFGLARVHNQELAMSSVVAGTPGFTPPEELFNRPLSKASDLYSLGAAAIALITHTPATQLSNLIDDNYQFQYQHLVTGINPDFIKWLDKMVAPNPKHRFATAEIALAQLKPIDLTKTSSKPTKDYLAIAISSAAILMISGSLFEIVREFQPITESVPSTNQITNSIPKPNPLSEAEQWFQHIKPRCNAVEVVTAMSNTSYPNTADGIGYAASCYALAGKLDLADRKIQKLPPNLRGQAAAIVFQIGHPVADAGDDRSAGPIMDLVLRYWSENYMALYHAGMSAYVLNDYPKALRQLTEFLQIYQRQDVWTDKARSAIDRMERGIPADESFSIHH